METPLTNEELTRMALLLKRAFKEAADAYEETENKKFRDTSIPRDLAAQLAEVSNAYLKASAEMQRRGL